MKFHLKNGNNKPDTDVQLRQVPYPYRAMLAICSDLDSTHDRHVYLEIMRFLNTTETTSIGQGVGLEVGNSIHFRAIAPQFSYWDTDDTGREIIRKLIHSGHIDCLHSFGELVYTRDEAKQALDELMRHDCRLKVWVDHGGAVTNFSSDIMQGHGDEPGHPAYHADLTIDYGIKYIWCGRVTSITGQDVRGNLSSIFNFGHPIASGRTIFKEIVKQRLGRKESHKYAMHGSNETIRPRVLRDGSSVYEFIRCNPHWGGVSSCDQGRFIGEVLTEDFLNRLIERSGSCILYTHLGKIDNPNVPFNKAAVSAFRRLAELHREGKILVTTTHRLLGYRRAVREIFFNTIIDENGLRININTRLEANSIGELSTSDLCGLTFYVPCPESASIIIDGREVTEIQRNELDHTGRASISLAWLNLEFPII